MGSGLLRFEQFATSAKRAVQTAKSMFGNVGPGLVGWICLSQAIPQNDTVRQVGAGERPLVCSSGGVLY